MAQNYTALLTGYPGLREQLAALNAQGGANQAGFVGSTRRALAEFGQVPAAQQLQSVLGPDANNYVDDLTRQLAGQATAGGVSTVAQLQEAQRRSNEGDLASLAARGLLRSGATAQHLNENSRTYQQDFYRANQALLDQIAQGKQTLLGQQAGLRNDAYNTVQNAYNGIVGGIKAGVYGSGAAGSPAGTAAPGAYQAASSGLAAANAPMPKPRAPAAPTSVALQRTMRFG